jgi:hypothetical protein
MYETKMVCEVDGAPPRLPTDNQLPPFMTTLEDWSISWSEELGPVISTVGVPDRGGLDLGDTGIEGPSICVEYDDGEQYNYPVDWMLDVFRPVNDQLLRRRADELREGDLVLVFDDDNFDSLWERIVEALEARQIRSRMLLEMWELTKRQALEQCEGDLGQLYDFLNDKGVSVQQQAVGNWVRGRTMGPQKASDFKLVALASRNRFAVENVDRMHSVVSKVRGLRRQVGRRLGAMVRQAVVSDGIETDVDGLGLAVDDILAAVSIRRVVRVQTDERAKAWEQVL